MRGRVAAHSGTRGARTTRHSLLLRHVLAALIPCVLYSGGAGSLWTRPGACPPRAEWPCERAPAWERDAASFQSYLLLLRKKNELPLRGGGGWIGCVCVCVCAGGTPSARACAHTNLLYYVLLYLNRAQSHYLPCVICTSTQSTITMCHVHRFVSFITLLTANPRTFFSMSCVCTTLLDFFFNSHILSPSISDKYALWRIV
jgi:hypothetical protein